jgi:exonuclease SbcD
VRILHTSDWHLGRQFHGQEMLTHQAGFFDHLLATVAAERVDLVVVSGDIYDRALPPVDAVALADDAFARLAGSRARIVVISGNHDSARRLGFNARLADAAGFHLRTDPARLDEPILLDDDHGTVAVYGIPYLEPDVMRQAWDLPTRSHEATLAAAMARVRSDLATRGQGRSVVLAHAFVMGGLVSDSERDIAVGGVSVVPAELFDGIDYVALGHLHGRHTLTPTIRYSGSPLAYSFSEADHVKGCWLIDLDASGLASSTFIDAPVPRPLARLTGTLDELVTAGRFSSAEQSWV